jgi:hypothetical protein
MLFEKSRTRKYRDLRDFAVTGFSGAPGQTTKASNRRFREKDATKFSVNLELT